MALIPKRNLVEELVEEGEVEQIHRPYLGCSGLGAKCERAVWLSFRWAYREFIPKRVLRIFNRGHLEEPRVIADLQAAGMIVTDDQLGFSDETGHIRGHIDGIVRNVPGDPDTPHLLEIKTMNGSRFKQFKKDGLALSNPTYYVQMNMYMGFSGLTKCLFIVTNKDTEERSYEIHEFDEQIFKSKLAFGHRILQLDEAPAKIGGPTWFDCKFCGIYEYCHKQAETVRNCRTCQFSELEMEGKWSCNYHKMIIDEDRQRGGCPEYYKMETLK